MKTILLTLLATTALSGVASAKDYYLAAVRTCITPAGAAAGSCIVSAKPADGDPVPVWSFVQITSDEYGAGAVSPAALATATVPGPLLTADSTDLAGLTIHLLNTLPVPVSLIVPDLPVGMTPVWIDPTNGQIVGTGTRPNLTARVRSLTDETAPGSKNDYAWPKLQAGSFLYESATHQAVQVQMGLHGALIVANGATTAGATTGSAYPNVSYAQQVAAYLVEIDATMHRAIDASPSHDATPDGSSQTVSPLEYWPNIFYTSLTKLTPDFTATQGSAGHSQIAAAQPTLLRFFNPTFRSHVQVVQNEALSVVAEDALPYPYVRNQYSVSLEAGKTKDALLLPVKAETVAIYDRMLSTGNKGNMQQGLLAFLDIQAGSTPTARNDSFSNLTVAAPGVLANDTSPDNQTLTAVLVTQPANGTVTLNADGSFTYTPLGTSTPTGDAFAYKATETVNGTTYSSNQATVTLAFAAAKPVAGNDAFFATQRTRNSDPPSPIPAPGVLANDSPAGVTIAITKAPTKGSIAAINADGSFTYTPNRNAAGTDSFQYTISTGTAVSDPATVTITLQPTPQAVSDTIAVAHGTTLSNVSLLGNDTGALGATQLTITRAPTRGTVTVNPDLTITYQNTSARAG